MENTSTTETKNNQNIQNNSLTEKVKGTLVDIYENKYEGEIINGEANGQGTKTYKDGRVYKGLFKNNKREGKGILYRPDGTIFEGKYKNDEQDGIGINTNKEGKKIIGFFKEGKVIKGKAIMYYDEQDRNKMHFTNKYEGDFQNNRREGYGTFIMNNGDRYEGEFQKDSYNGSGIYYWANGNKYEGGFKNNKKEGKGILSFNDGEMLDCLWKDDNPLDDVNILDEVDL